jgi:hypothetical protein
MLLNVITALNAVIIHTEAQISTISHKFLDVNTRKWYPYFEPLKLRTYF